MKFCLIDPLITRVYGKVRSLSKTSNSFKQSKTNSVNLEIQLGIALLSGYASVQFHVDY